MRIINSYRYEAGVAPLPVWGDVSSFSYNGDTKNLTPTHTIAWMGQWSDDGLKFYTGRTNTKTIYEWDASTAFDVSTITFSKSQSIPQNANGVKNIKWYNNGLKAIIGGWASKDYYQYTASTAFDVSTLTYDSVTYFGGGSQSACMFWSYDGMICYFGSGGNVVYRHDATVAYDISTLSSTNNSSAITGAGTHGIAIDPSGTKMWLLDDVGTIRQYTLSTAWDIQNTSWSYDSISLDVSAQGTKMYDMDVNYDGDLITLTDNSLSSVFQYSI